MFTFFCKTTRKTGKLFTLLLVVFLFLSLAGCDDTVSSDGADGYFGTISNDGKEYLCKATIVDGQLVLSVMETHELTAGEKEEIGISGLLSVTQTRKVYLNITSTKNNILSAETASWTIYTSVTMSGNDVKSYISYVSSKLEDSLKGGDISREEYDKNLAMLSGEEIAFKVKEGGLCISIMLDDAENTFNVFSVKHFDENGNILFLDSYMSHEFPNGVVRWKYEYAENGGYSRRKYYEGKLLEYWEYNAENVRIKFYSYNYRDDGTLIETLKDYDYRKTDDGFVDFLATEVWCEYDKNGKVDSYSKYVYEYYDNGSKKEETQYAENGKLIRNTEYHENGKEKKIICYDENGKVSVEREYEYYEDGAVKTSYEMWLTDDGTTCREYREYDENGICVIFVMFRDDGGFVKYEYSSNKELKTYTTYDENGTIRSREEFYENGKTKALILYDDHGNEARRIEYDEKGNRI